jgi:hypothetical protein
MRHLRAKVIARPSTRSSQPEAEAWDPVRLGISATRCRRFFKTNEGWAPLPFRGQERLSAATGIANFRLAEPAHVPEVPREESAHAWKKRLEVLGQGRQDRFA